MPDSTTVALVIITHRVRKQSSLFFFFFTIFYRASGAAAAIASLSRCLVGKWSSWGDNDRPLSIEPTLSSIRSSVRTRGQYTSCVYNAIHSRYSAIHSRYIITPPPFLRKKKTETENTKKNLDRCATSHIRTLKLLSNLPTSIQSKPKDSETQQILLPARYKQPSGRCCVIADVQLKEAQHITLSTRRNMRQPRSQTERK